METLERVVVGWIGLLLFEEVFVSVKIPYIEKYQNNKFYGGNYYKALRRDGFKCRNCGTNANLNMHHVIGYRKEHKACVDTSSLITLCRKCHSKEHSLPHSKVTDEILKEIGFDFSLYGKIEKISNNTGKKKLNEEYR